MGTLTLTIKNLTLVPHKLRLFDVLTNVNATNCGLPNGVAVSIKESPSYTYKEFLQHIMIVAPMVEVASSTNNRQIDFYFHDPHGMQAPMEPGLTKDGKPRPRKYFKVKYSDRFVYRDWDYRTKWNPKKWNAADTHEPFMLDISVLIELLLKPYQEFKLAFNLHERLQIKMTK